MDTVVPGNSQFQWSIIGSDMPSALGLVELVMHMLKILELEYLLVELVMHMLKIVVQQFVLLLIRVFNHSTWKAEDQDMLKFLVLSMQWLSEVCWYE